MKLGDAQQSTLHSVEAAAHRILYGVQILRAAALVDMEEHAAEGIHHLAEAGMCVKFFVDQLDAMIARHKGQER